MQKQNPNTNTDDKTSDDTHRSRNRKGRSRSDHSRCAGTARWVRNRNFMQGSTGAIGEMEVVSSTSSRSTKNCTWRKDFGAK